MVKLLYFSIVKEKIGKQEEDLDFSGSLRELKELLKSRYPELGNVWDAVRFAVNEEYVDENYELSDNDRVAIIPPVSGG